MCGSRFSEEGAEVMAQLIQKEKTAFDALFFLFSSTYFTEGEQWFFQRKL